MILRANIRYGAGNNFSMRLESDRVYTVDIGRSNCFVETKLCFNVDFVIANREHSFSV